MTIVPLLLLSLVGFYVGLAAFLTARILKRHWSQHRLAERQAPANVAPALAEPKALRRRESA